MKKFSPYLTIIRPANSLMVGFAVVVGVALASPDMILTFEGLVGFLTGFFICSYSMIINDYYDIEVDRVNNPTRPLPSGMVSKVNAIIFALTLLALGLITSTLTGLETVCIASSFSLIAWIYSSCGKKSGLFGNFMVASSISIPFIYGAVSIGTSGKVIVWFLALTSFLAGAGREIVKSIADVKGDELRSVKSVARIYGAERAAHTGAIFFAAAIVSASIPILIDIVGLAYIILILIPDAIFIYAIMKILKDQSAENALFIKKVALIGMATGLITFIIGGIY